MKRDLVRARLETARAELAQLGHELEDSLAIERATAELYAASLGERVGRLQAAATEQRQAFEDERTLLQRDVTVLAGRTEQSLAEFAAEEPGNWERQLVEVARGTPVDELEDVLRQTVERLVQESFEQFRRSEAADAEEAWRRLAERFRDRTQDRVNAVRTAAAELERSVETILIAPARAEELRSTAELERQHHMAEREEACRAASAAIAFAAV